MITYDDYLKAKDTIRYWENNRKFVAVISLNTHVFQAWKERQNFDVILPETTKRKVVTETTTYVEISREIDVCSWRFDDVIELEYLPEKNEYERIKNSLALALNDD